LAGYVNSGLLFYNLHKQQIFDPEKGWSIFLTRIGLACLVMGGLAWGLSPTDAWWQTTATWPKIGVLTGLIVLALSSYFATLRLLGMPFKQMLGR
jgi:putative peptidoglycan lipid II flippase